MVTQPSAKLFGWDLSHWSRRNQLIFCISGIFFFFCFYGFLQEYIFRIEGFRFGWYLTFIQFALYSLFAYFEMVYYGEFERRSPLSKYLIISFFMVSTMGMSNTACGYLPYPTQVLFKSAKLIPVMIGGRFILGRRYGWLDYMSAVSIVFGLATLTLADVSVAYSWHPIGVALLCGALVGDAFISNLQEKTMKEFDVSKMEMVFYSHIIGCGYLVIILLGTGQLSEAVSFCSSNPRAYVAMLLFASFGYAGIQFVLATILMFDNFVAMTVTSCRKATTIFLSFLIFPKPFSIQYLFAILLVFGGIALQLYQKNTKQFWEMFRFLSQKVAIEKHKLETIKVV